MLRNSLMLFEPNHERSKYWRFPLLYGMIHVCIAPPGSKFKPTGGQKGNGIPTAKAFFHTPQSYPISQKIVRFTQVHLSTTYKF